MAPLPGGGAVVASLWAAVARTSGQRRARPATSPPRGDARPP